MYKRQLRHALAKATFSRLFDWLVQRANKAFDKSDQSQFIGILDIFGFEDMATNGFEQVFINTTNEQLQKVFNDLVFEAEAEEYTREGADSASCMTLNLTSSRDRRDAVV